MSSLILLIFFMVWAPITIIAAFQATEADWLESLLIVIFVTTLMMIPGVTKRLLWFISGPHERDTEE